MSVLEVSNPSEEQTVPQKLSLPGKGYVQGCCAFSDGRVFVARWSCIVEVDEGLVPSIYAGDPSEYNSVMGHRLKVARFHNIHTVAAARDRLLVFDYGASILVQIERDEVSHLAGSGTKGTEDGPKDKATFDYIWGIAVTSSGYILLCDRDSHRIRVISPDGMVTSIGNGFPQDVDGSNPLQVSFHSPFGIAVAPNDSIYVGCNSSSKIRIISPDLQKVSTVEAHSFEQLSKPEGFTCDTDGKLYICNNSDQSIIEYDPETCKSRKLPLTTDSPRGICIPKKGHLFVSENVNHHEGSLFTLKNHEVQAFRPIIYNMRLFKDNRFDFVGFNSLSPYQCSLISNDPLRHLNRGTELEFHSESIPESFQATNLLQLPTRSEPLLIHQDILNLIPTEVSLESALKGLDRPENGFDLPKLFLRFLYQCGHSIDLSDVEDAKQLHVYTMMSLAVVRMGFCSSYLRDQISKKMTNFSKKLQELTTPTVISLLVLLTTMDDPILDVCVLDILCEFLSNPRNEFKKYLDKTDCPFTQLDRADASFYRIILERIESPNNSLTSLLGWKGEKRNPNYIALPTHVSDIYDAICKSLSDQADLLNWSPMNQCNEAEYEGQNGSPHLWQISIAGNPKTLKVPNWLLYCRWKYFRRMIGSGMGETTTRCLELPNDFTPQALLQLMRYLYLLAITPSLNMDQQNSKCLLPLTEEYELMNSEGIPAPGFCALIHAAKASAAGT